MLLKQKKIVSLIIFILFLGIGTNAYTVSSDNLNKSVYMVIINRLSLNDLKTMENTRQLINQGSVGLMNTRGTYGYTGSESYITINASTRSYADYSTSQFFNLDEANKTIYARRMGEINDNSQIANIEFNRLINLNTNKGYVPFIGALGDNLHRSGLKSAVFGNSDTADSFIRTNCLIAMDSRGLIDYGNIDNILVEDEKFPFGIKTDYEKILHEINILQDEASFFVIETGDINRLQSYSNQLNDEMYRFHRSNIINEIDNFIGGLLSTIDKDNSMIIIVSPNGSDDRVDKSRLSPLILWNNDSNGLLTSGTTRREGIVSNIDIAPTITEYLDAKNDNFIGRSIVSTSSDESLEYISLLNDRVNTVASLRPYMLNIYSVLIILVFIILIVLAFIKLFNNKKVTTFINICIISIISMPLYFLLISFFHIKGRSTYILFLILYLIMIQLITIKLHFKTSILLVTGTTLAAILIDITTGGNLIKFSVLGYDPIIGARYFGIGNELVGVLLSVLTIFAGFYSDRSNKRIIPALVLLVAVGIVGHPRLGANVGGTISIVIATMVFILLSFEIKLTVNRLILIIGVLFAILTSMVIIDIFFTESPSHLGRIVLNTFSKGPLVIIETILRKLQMNIKLIGTTIWSKVLYVSLINLAFVFVFLKNRVRELLNDNKYIFIGLLATILGSITGLLVNDSGILLASIANIFTTSALLYGTIGYTTRKN